MTGRREGGQAAAPAPRAPGVPPGPMLLLHTCATGVLIGLIWTIQLVHYPLFAAVGREAWPAYAAGHGARITVLVAPWMLLELVSGAWLVLRPPAALPATALRANLAAIVLVWLLTALVNGPLFTRLAAGWDDALHRQLVLANWARTALWTAKGSLVLWLLWRAGQAAGAAAGGLEGGR